MPWLNPSRSDEEGDDCADQKNHKQNLRYPGGAGSDSAKSKERGDQGNDQKYDGIVQHMSPFLKVASKVSLKVTYAQ